jgi:hypothetical protein
MSQRQKIVQSSKCRVKDKKVMSDELKVKNTEYQGSEYRFGEIAAGLAGGKHGKRRRRANFVCAKAQHFGGKLSYCHPIGATTARMRGISAASRILHLRAGTSETAADTANPLLPL